MATRDPGPLFMPLCCLWRAISWFKMRLEEQLSCIHSRKWEGKALSFKETRKKGTSARLSLAELRQTAEPGCMEAGPRVLLADGHGPRQVNAACTLVSKKGK